MIDFHSHVLPGIDDGSASVEVSLQMLARSAEQGIELVCLTPHFYPSREDPKSFLHARAHAWEKLKPNLPENAPKTLLGAEVYFFSGISRNEEIAGLELEGTDILLLEMPFEKWSDAIVREVVELNDRPEVRVMLAHIERYIKYQSRDVWEYFLDNRIIMQSNAEFFLDWKTKHKALRMLRQGRIHVISSDAHNLTDRRPRIGEALEAIPDEDAYVLRESAKDILEHAIVRHNG